MVEQQKLYKLLSDSVHNWYDDENPDEIDSITQISVLRCENDEKLHIRVFNNNKIETTLKIPILNLITNKKEREYYIDKFEIKIKEVIVEGKYITIIVQIENLKNHLIEKFSYHYASKTLQEYKHENSSSE